MMKTIIFLSFLAASGLLCAAEKPLSVEVSGDWIRFNAGESSPERLLFLRKDSITWIEMKTDGVTKDKVYLVINTREAQGSSDPRLHRHSFDDLTKEQAIEIFNKLSGMLGGAK